MLKKLSFWNIMAGLFLLSGLIAVIVRFAAGLGAATNLSDMTPWGLWVGFDVVTGVGLAAGGFTLAGLVYIFNVKRFKPILRPAILTAFLGYLFAIIGLMFDLGRPWLIWHALIYQNPHSVLFEVAMCVMMYTAVLALEFSPVVMERFKLQRTLKFMKAITIPLIIFGILLSMLHQSSLGSLYLIIPQKMHPFWSSPLLPFQFFISAIAVGLGMTIVESYLSSRAFQKALETPLLRQLARIMIGVILVYFTIRFLDLSGRGALPLLLDGSMEAGMMWIELLFMLVLPIVLFNIKNWGQSRQGLFFTGISFVIGFVTNRLNTTMTAIERYYNEQFGISYFPSVGELAVTIAIVTMGFVLFGLAVKYLDIFPHYVEEEETVLDLATGKTQHLTHGEVLPKTS